MEDKLGKILIVDDSSTNRLILKAILTKMGYETDECVDGQECVEYCEKHLPDAILLDVMMPRLDGISACKELRKSHTRHDLPIIMVTTKNESGDVAEGLESGANDYVVKPIDRAVLLARLETQLSFSNAQKKIKEQSAVLEEALNISQASGDVLPEGVLVHDFDLNIVQCTRKVVEFCGGKEPGNFQEVVESIFQGSFKSYLSNYLLMLETDSDYEAENEIDVQVDDFTNIRFLTKPISMPDDRQLRLCLWHDLSSMRDLERTASQQMQLDTVALFAAGVAHNFNNLMCSVLGATAILKRRVSEASSVKYLDMIEQGVDFGTKLTKKLEGLFASNESETTKCEDLKLTCEVVWDSVHLLMVEPDETHKEIEFKVSCPLPINNISMPEEALRVLFVQLFSNSIEAIESSGLVECELDYIDDRKQVRIVIQDNGCGMEPKLLKRVYEPFYSTKNLDERNGVSMQGNGLGLWNVYSIIKKFHGSIDVNSTPGGGFSVSMTIPVLVS